MLRCSPVAVCLFLSASIPAGCLPVSWPVWLTVSLCISVAAACRTGKPARLSVSVCSAAVLLRGARLSQAELWVGLNPGDIRWRDARRCHYPCGEPHHHPAAEKALGTPAREDCERDSRDSLTSARKLWWSCEKTTPEKRLGICSSSFRVCIMGSYWKPAKMAASDSEIHPPAASNHSRSRARIPGINWNV